jgi:hypothetical protein
MAYGFSHKFRSPGSGLNGIAFVRKQLIPGDAGFKQFRIGPPAEFPWSNAENTAGALLGKAFINGFFYNSNHGFFNRKLEMAG